MRSSNQSLMMTAGFVLLVVLVGFSMAVTGSAAAQSAGFVDVDASDLEGSGTTDDPYLITNASELQAIEDDPHVHYKLGNDIDASATSKWNGGSGFAIIETFTGHFDGNQYEINGLSIDRNSTSSVGLFSEIHDATVENVHISNSSIRGRDDVGILAGSSSEESVIRNVSTGGTVVGVNTVGGLIGYNIGSSVVTQSSSSADITVSPAGQDTPNDAGGLVGANLRGGIINQSYATGDVDGIGRTGGLLAQNFNNSHVAYTYAIGSVNGSDAGGLVAGNYASSTVTNSYWNTETSGISTSDGDATGLTTNEMTGSSAEANMAGFEFGTTWETRTDDYPRLIGVNEPPAEPSDGPGDVTDNGQAATDPDNNGLYEDVNGDGSAGFSDLISLYQAFSNNRITDANEQYFDFNGDGEVDFADLIALYSEELQ